MEEVERERNIIQLYQEQPSEFFKELFRTNVKILPYQQKMINHFLNNDRKVGFSLSHKVKEKIVIPKSEITIKNSETGEILVVYEVGEENFNQDILKTRYRYFNTKPLKDFFLDDGRIYNINTGRYMYFITDNYHNWYLARLFKKDLPNDTDLKYLNSFEYYRWTEFLGFKNQLDSVCRKVFHINNDNAVRIINNITDLLFDASEEVIIRRIPYYNRYLGFSRIARSLSFNMYTLKQSWYKDFLCTDNKRRKKK